MGCSGRDNPAADSCSQRRHVRGGQRVCDGPYALCSSAKCQAIDGDPHHVKCTCEGPLQGLNIANSTCQARTNALTSTFSLWDPTATNLKPAKSSLACTGKNAGKWAFCLDAPCSVENGTVSCRCQLRPASDYYTFIDDARRRDVTHSRLCRDLVRRFEGRTVKWFFAIDAVLRQSAETGLLPRGYGRQSGCAVIQDAAARR